MAGITLAWLLPAALPAQAAPNKPFSVVFTPEAPDVSSAAALPGGMTLTLKTTLTSQSNQNLGSVNITVPSGYVATPISLDRGSFSVLSTGQIALRGLNALPGVPVNLRMTVRLPCPRGASAWGIDAKQSNDFNGTGNDLTTPQAADRSTTIASECRLHFVNEPAGATVTTKITSVPFREVDENSVPEPAVTVEALDGRATGAQVLDWFTGPVSLVRTDGGAASGASANAVAGVASFPSLQITSAGFFFLRASTTAGFVAGPTSPQFPITDKKADCKPNQCTDTIGSTTLTGTTTGQGDGFVLLSDNVTPNPVCTGYVPPGNRWYDFMVTVPATKLVLTTYTKTEMKAFGGNATDLKICFAVPFGGVFDTGFNYDNDATTGLHGEEGRVGLLTDCPLTPTIPCVTRRGPFGNGGAFIEFFAPSELTDPRFH